MDERLKNLKKAVDQTAFQQVKFTAQHEEQIRKQLQTSQLKETILTMLAEAKSGVELTQMLHVRGAEAIVNNEGLIYSVLHECEQQHWLSANWVDGVKYYQLTKLGKKQLQQSGTEKLSIKERILGVRMHAE
ncbi:MAG: helix-turn-helix transcriptional regulator [Solibacillus sp.]